MMFALITLIAQYIMCFQTFEHLIQKKSKQEAIFTNNKLSRKISFISGIIVFINSSMLLKEGISPAVLPKVYVVRFETRIEYFAYECLEDSSLEGNIEKPKLALPVNLTAKAEKKSGEDVKFVIKRTFVSSDESLIQADKLLTLVTLEASSV